MPNSERPQPSTQKITPTKLSIKIKGEMRTHKNISKEFMASKPYLQRILQGVFYAEEKDIQEITESKFKKHQGK